MKSAGGKPVAAAAASAACFLWALTACSGEQPSTALPTVPSTLALRQYATTTEGIDRTGEVIEPLSDAGREARRPAVGFSKGKVTIRGVVRGPNGVVPGAVVRLERISGTNRAVGYLQTDTQGRFALANVTGGRLRLRAWRSPDFAGTESIVDFAVGDFAKDLEVRGFGEMTVRWGIAPSIPVEGRAANVVVQITKSVVGIDGVVRPEPIVGVGITVTPLGLLQPEAVQSSLSSAQGRVQIAMRCFGAGPSSLLVALATGEQAKIEPPACDPALIPTVTRQTEVTSPAVVDTQPSVDTVQPPASVVDAGPVPVAPTVGTVPIPAATTTLAPPANL